MTSALELEGKLDYSKAIDLQAPDLVKVFPLAAIFESLRFRADGQRLARDNVHMTMGVSITDANLDFSLVLRNGVMEFSEKKPDNADIQVSWTSKTLGEIITVSSEGDKHSPVVLTPVDKLLIAITGKKVKLDAGKADQIKKFFSYFDSPNIEKFPITLK